MYTMKEITITAAIDYPQLPCDILPSEWDNYVKEIIKDTSRRLAVRHQGYTLSYHEGGYAMQESGELVQERSITYTTYVSAGESSYTGRIIAIKLKESLYQESVLFTTKDVDVDFI